MNLADMMEGLREGAAKQTKFMGITLTQVEVGPILAEYAELRAEVERLTMALQQIIERYAASEEGWPAEDMRAIARAALEPKP
jgi:hypothetical protein